MKINVFLSNAHRMQSENQAGQDREVRFRYMPICTSFFSWTCRLTPIVRFEIDVNFYCLVCDLLNIDFFLLISEKEENV